MTKSLFTDVNNKQFLQNLWILKNSKNCWNYNRLSASDTHIVLQNKKNEVELYEDQTSRVTKF